MLKRFELEKEFTAETFGQRVGWSEVHHSTEGRQWVAVNMAVGTVTGEEGAQYGREIFMDADGVVGPSFPKADGFSAAVAFTGLISEENRREYESHFNFRTRESSVYGRIDDEELMARGSLEQYLAVENTQRIWSIGASALMGTLRDQLSAAGYEEGYKNMYLWINATVGRDQNDTTGPYDGIAERDLLMPDTSMAEHTAQQISRLQEMLSAYTTAIGNNNRMSENLILPADRAARRGLPDAFIASRRQAAYIEKNITDSANGLTVRRLGFVPIGHGRQGRTWPFMDALARDEDAAFGPELKAIRASNFGIALHELDREKKELESRKSFAAGILQRFELLHSLETKL